MKKPQMIILRDTAKHFYLVEGEGVDEFLNAEAGTYDSIPASFWCYLYIGKGKGFTRHAYHVLGCDVDKTWAI